MTSTCTSTSTFAYGLLACWVLSMTSFFRSLHHVYGSLGEIHVDLEPLDLTTSSSNVALELVRKLPKDNANKEDWILRLDAPYMITWRLPLMKKQSKVIIISAIQQEDRISFIVKDGLGVKGMLRFKEGSNDEIVRELPLGFKCLFHTLTEDRNVDDYSMTTNLTVYAAFESFYYTSSIWTCDLPHNYNHNHSHKQQIRYVSILSPSWAEPISGSGTFSITKPGGSHELLANKEIISCNKNVYNINQATTAVWGAYASHYRRLGVEHFVIYVEEGDDLEPAKDLVRNITAGMIRHDFTLIVVPEVYRKLTHETLPQKRIQPISVNDCLWRARANNVTWGMMQYDPDEFLVGTPNFKNFLSRYKGDVLYVPHWLASTSTTLDGGTGIPDAEPGRTVNISSSNVTSWGKTTLRPDKVDVAWVHAPTSPKLDLSRLPNFKLLHFREGHYKKMGNRTWVEYQVV